VDDVVVCECLFSFFVAPTLNKNKASEEDEA